MLNTTKVVSSNSVYGEVYSIQHYVIKFFSDLRQVGGFLRSSRSKTDRHDMAEILLKLVLNTINHHNLKIEFIKNQEYLLLIKP